MRFAILVVAAALLCLGCTNMALERATLAQASSVADLRYSEVLENLAMVADDPAVLPAYSSIFAGTAEISDTAAANSTTLTLVRASRGAVTFGMETIDVPLSRNIKENWTLDPVVVPEKLRALRCACRWILTRSGDSASDSDVHLAKYKPPHGCGNRGEDSGFYFDVMDRLNLIPPDWLHVGRRQEVPHDACYHAHCHDTYVWVTPDGIDGLTKFALVVQAIARVQIDTVYFPQPVINTVKVVKQWTPESEVKPGNRTITSTATLYVDQEGWLVPNATTAAIPLKVRNDNIGTNAGLRSLISTSSK